MIMHRIMTLLAAVFLVCGSVLADSRDDELNALYQTLDSLVEHQPEIITQKKARIQVITDGLDNLKQIGRAHV